MMPHSRGRKVGECGGGMLITSPPRGASWKHIFHDNIIMIYALGIYNKCNIDVIMKNVAKT